MDNQLINIANSNGVLTVRSREVAEHFEKQHKNVLQKIDDLIIKIQPAENSARYFLETEYIDEKGENRKEYQLTRDGFSLLVMGFTGKKALEWKLKYIDAFNKMETAFKQKLPTLDDAQAQELKIRQDRATAMLLNAQNRMIKTLLSNTKDKNLSQIAMDVMGIKAVEQITGNNMQQYLPECEKLYSATEVGKMLGVSAMKIGQTANKNGLKTDAYGKMVMSKSQHSSKEVNQFLYNEEGIKALSHLLGQNKTA